MKTYRFKVGDWIVIRHITMQITGFDYAKDYSLKDIKGNRHFCYSETVDKYAVLLKEEEKAKIL
jgi:hypothetical protein